MEIGSYLLATSAVDYVISETIDKILPFHQRQGAMAAGIALKLYDKVSRCDNVYVECQLKVWKVSASLYGKKCTYYGC